MSQRCECPNLGSHFLCVLLQCQHGVCGQMSAAPKRSLEWLGMSMGTSVRDAVLAAPLISPEAGDEPDPKGLYRDIYYIPREKPRNELALPAQVKESPRSISQGGSAMEMIHPIGIGRGWVQETLPRARSCLSEPNRHRLTLSITFLPPIKSNSAFKHRV